MTVLAPITTLLPLLTFFSITTLGSKVTCFWLNSAVGWTVTEEWRPINSCFSTKKKRKTSAKDFLGFSRSPSEIEYMKQIKKVFEMYYLLTSY